MMNGSSKVSEPLDGPAIHNNDSDRIDDDDILSDPEDDDSMNQGMADAGHRNSKGEGFTGFLMDLVKDLWVSSGLVINNRLNWLLVLGPIALLGSATEWLGDTACFAFSGLALIPCAERYVPNI